MLRTRRRIAIVCALAAAISALVIWFATPSSLVTGVHARQRARIDRLEQEPRVRPPIGGGVRAGDAWPEYIAVFAAANALPPPDLVMLDDWWQRRCGRKPGGRPPDDSELRALVGRFNADLDHLKDGARAESARFPVNWRNPEAFTRPLSGMGNAMRMLWLRTTLAWKAGQVTQALEDLAASLQVACDTARTPTLTGPDFGSEMAFFALFDWEEFVASGSFSEEESRRLEQVLSECDRQIPALGDIFETHVAMRGVVLFLDVKEGFFPPRDWPWWRRWPARLSPDKAVANLMVAFETSQEQLRGIERMTWPQAALLHARLPFRRKDTADWWVNWGNTASSDLALRCWVARLRLLRSALLLRLGSGPADPAWPLDPFTLRPIATREEADAFVAWCASDDGDNVERGGLYRQQDRLAWDLEIRVPRKR